MWGYMKVVCLILVPMLASRPCLHTFWVLTSLHFLSFLLKMYSYSCVGRAVQMVSMKVFVNALCSDPDLACIPETKSLYIQAV